VAVQRNKEYGDNALTEKKKLPWWIEFGKYLVGLFQILLWIGALLAMVAYIIDTDDVTNVSLKVNTG